MHEVPSIDSTKSGSNIGLVLATDILLFYHLNDQPCAKKNNNKKKHAFDINNQSHLILI